MGKLFRSYRLRWTAVYVSVLAVALLVFASNRILYLSHQRFPLLTLIQLDHQANVEASVFGLQIIGHRGSGRPSTDPNAKPKNRLIGNTRESIQAAIDANVHWIEIDIRRSSDKELVVFHDSKIAAKTTYNGAEELKSHTLQDLQSYDVLVQPPEKILALDDVFETFDMKQRNWIFDIKSDQISEDVLDWLAEKELSPDRVIIIGDYDVLLDYQDAGYRLGYTTLFSKHYLRMFFTPNEILDRCERLRCKLIVVPIIFVTPSFVSNATARDIDVWCYDSNAPQDLKYAVECGVAGLIVDDPEAVMTQFFDHVESR